MKKLKRADRKIVIGITGGYGSGKSTVAAFFRMRGVRVIDADRIARSLLKPGSGIYKSVIHSFGRGITGKGGAIDRRRLAGIAFSSRPLIKKLNNIMHPEVLRIIKKEIAGSRGRIVVVDAPLLIETGLKSSVDKLIVVKVNREEQIRRVHKKTGFNRNDILKRIRAQVPLREKLRLADFVIDNNSTIRKTKEQTKQIIRRMLWKS
ncbi:MAG: dephospho-CoA kinase [Candidatus Omnitrophota bacterium]|jgi:dephospho-CoA kinase